MFRRLQLPLSLIALCALLWLGWQATSDERREFTGEITPLAAAAPDSVSHSEGTRVAPASNDDPTLYGRRDTPARSDRETFAQFNEWMVEFITGEELSPAFLEDGVLLATQRREAMVRLIRSDPEQALRRSIPLRQQESLPPEIRAHLETAFDAHGDLEVLLVCAEHGFHGVDEEHEDEVSRVMTISDGRFDAYVYGRREGQKTKYDIPLHGIRLDGVAAVHERPLRELAFFSAPGESVVQMGSETLVLPNTEAVAHLEDLLVADEGASGPAPAGHSGAAASSWTLGEKSVLYIRVDFADLRGAPLSVPAATAAMDEADRFFRQNSYGQTGFRTTVLPETLRLPATTTDYRSSGYLQLRDDALAAARAYDASNGGSGEFNPDRHDLYILAFATVFPGWAGRAAVGGRGVWLNGSFDAGVTAHEIGHNYGVFHANAWEPSERAPAGDGRHLEYADRFDVMGISSNVFGGNFRDGHFNAWFKSYLGWIEPETGHHDVTQSGVFRLYRHDHPETGGLRALQIHTGENTAFWIGVRRLFTGNARLMNGVDIRRSRTVFGMMSSQGSQLLDMQPQSAAGFDDHALVAGDIFADDERSISIAVVAAGGEGASAWVDVEVLLGSTRPPEIEDHPESQAGVEGQSVTFRVRAKGSIPLAYQWLKDGTEIPGADRDHHRIPFLRPGDAGAYAVRVSNAHGNALSHAAILEVIRADDAVAGAIDPSFDPVSGPNGPVYALAPAPGGTVYIGGNFTHVGGLPRNRIARLLPDGAVDPSFDPGAGFDNTVWTLAVQSDGRVIAGGMFLSADGMPRHRIARLEANGRIDREFAAHTGANQAVRALALLADGRIYVGGAFTSFAGQSAGGIVRLFPDGLPDPSFQAGSGAAGSVWSILPVGETVYVGGAFPAFNGIARSGLTRLHGGGETDFSFNPGQGVGGAVYALLADSNGGVVIGGSFSEVQGLAAPRIARLHGSGAVDTSFAPGAGADDFIWSLARQADGRILAGGWFRNFDQQPRGGVVRLLEDGRLDTTFDPRGGANDYVWPIAIDQTGAILLAGRFTRVGDTLRNRVARLHGELFREPVPQSSRYEDWAQDVAGAIAGPTDDPGGWGIPNLLRYAFGLHPDRPERERLPALAQPRDASAMTEAPTFGLTFYRKKNASDVLYSVEGSHDLVTWTTLPEIAIVEVEDLGEMEKVTVRDANAEGTPARFLRVRVSLRRTE